MNEELELYKDLLSTSLTYIESLRKRIQKKQERIDKSIKYIKDLYDVRFTDKDKRKLLEILEAKNEE